MLNYSRNLDLLVNYGLFVKEDEHGKIFAFDDGQGIAISEQGLLYYLPDWENRPDINLPITYIDGRIGHLWVRVDDFLRLRQIPFQEKVDQEVGQQLGIRVGRKNSGA